MMLHRTVLSAALALLLPGAGAACEYLTANFELCSEDTPWAAGTWENGGDSATLYLGKIGYEGYEQFVGEGEKRSLGGALNHILGYRDDKNKRKHHLRDRLTTADLKIVRSIDTMTYKTRPPSLLVTMLAEGAGNRIELTLEAPADTPLDEVDRLSRAYAALVRPRPPMQEN